MKGFLIAFVILISCSVHGQLSTVEGKTTYNFWLNLPADSILKNNPPVLIFLHGRSLSGNDLSRVKRYGVICEIEKGRKVPPVVIAPQVPSGQSWNPDLVLEVLAYIQTEYATDTNRVYVCGMSLGGYGTMSFAGKYPDKVTAGVALCGGGNVGDACNLAQLPFWIQHGTADSAVPISESRKMMKAINACNEGENLIYKEIPGASHGAMEKMFRSDEMYNWMFEHSK